MSGIDAGSLDREFRLQRPSGLGGDEYLDVETIWGAIHAASGSELLRFGTLVATGASVVTIRYREDLRASWRLVESDTSPERALQITSFGDPDGSREQLQVFVTELQ